MNNYQHYATVARSGSALDSHNNLVSSSASTVSASQLCYCYQPRPKWGVLPNNPSIVVYDYVAIIPQGSDIKTGDTLTDVRFISSGSVVTSGSLRVNEIRRVAMSHLSVGLLKVSK